MFYTTTNTVNNIKMTLPAVILSTVLCVVEGSKVTAESFTHGNPAGRTFLDPFYMAADSEQEQLNNLLPLSAANKGTRGKQQQSFLAV